MRYLFTAVVLAMLFNSCDMKKKEIDALVFNANIYTVNESFSVVNAMAIEQGKIIDTGSFELLSRKYNSKTEIDLEGNFVYPGFYDGHCHFLGYGLNLNQADLSNTTSFNEVIERLKAYQKINTSTWIIGRGWDQNDWETAEFPTKELLDNHFPENPVFLTRIDGHAALVNSVAIDISGIAADTKVEGGEIITRNGEPTGILIDNAIGLVSSKIPEPVWDEKRNALQKAEKHCFSVGLTSVADAGLTFEDIQIIQSMHNDSSLQMRVYAMLLPTEENLDRIVKKGIIQTEKLTVRSIKLYADGALGSRGALLLKPYSDDANNYGLQLHETKYLSNLCEMAYEHNYQVNTHCIGDSANRLMLQIYSDFLNEGNDHRWRIEHAQIVHPDDLIKYGKYSVIPSIQATHATSDMYWAGARLGEERLSYAYAYRELLEQNGWLVNGSDFPVESINPLLGFYAAVARMDIRQYPENGFQPENALTREQALRAMTIWAAKAGFEENLKGSLEPGKVADFVMLDKDIMKINVSEIPAIKVQATYIDGKKVYSAR